MVTIPASEKCDDSDFASLVLLESTIRTLVCQSGSVADDGLAAFLEQTDHLQANCNMACDTEQEVEPATVVDVYKRIIDTLVQETRLSASSSDLVESGRYPNAPAHQRFNDFIQSLSSLQRQTLAELLQEERDDAIHDVLAVLSWWVDCHDVGFTYRGEDMPVDLSGMGLHGDYVGRRDGWEWPSDDAG